MYIINPYYLEALYKEDRRTRARIKINDITINNENIKNIKYDLSINDSEKFTIGGVYGATATVTLLNMVIPLDVQPQKFLQVPGFILTI